MRWKVGLFVVASALVVACADDSKVDPTSSGSADDSSAPGGGVDNGGDSTSTPGGESSGGGDGGGGGGGGGSCSEPSCTSVQQVQVSLVEFSVTPTPSAVNAGNVEFDVRNDSPETIHEFLVVKTSFSIAELPRNPDGSFDENCPSAPVIGEIEDIDPGVTVMLTLDLSPGHYVLLCNMVEVEEDGEIESHFAQGMHVDFNVL